MTPSKAKKTLSSRASKAGKIAAATATNVATIDIPRVDLRWLRGQPDAPIDIPDLQGSLRGYQRVGVSSIVCTPRLVLADDPGLGKAQPLDSRILTPVGWVPMGHVRVGDQVIGRDGKACRVTGVYPQGERDVYRVTFTDGAVVECCDEHLWTVQNHNDRRRGGKWRTLPLKDIRISLRRSDQDNARNWYVPLVAPVEFSAGDVPLPLDPYVLGCLLGDGGLSQRNTMLSSADSELLDIVSARLPKQCSLVYTGHGCDYRIVGSEHQYNPVRATLDDLGLRGCTSHTKFIPYRYLHASVDDRLALLRGLLDTDGHVRPKDNNVEFVTVSDRLASDVVFLVRSLGGIARLKLKKSPQCYRITVQMPGDTNPFLLTRKATVYRPRTKYPVARAIDSVVWSRRAHVQCISVDAPDQLYVTDDFVVTHNTITTLAALRFLMAMGAITRTLIVTPRALLYQWVSEAEKWFPGVFRIVVIEGTPNQRKNIYEKLAKLDRHPLHHADLVFTTYSLMRNDADSLSDVRFDQVVFDEVSALRNYQAEQSKAAVRMVHNIPRRLAISATPMQNHLEEWHSVMAVIDPDVLGPRARFVRRYCNTARFPITVRGQRRMIEKITGYRGLEFFKEELEQSVLRRTIEEVGAQMPSLTIVDHWVDLTPAQKARYDEVERGILSLNGEDQLLEAIQRVTRLGQICNDLQLVFPDEEGAAKVDALERLLTADLQGRSVVLFSKSVEFFRTSVEPMLRRNNITFGEIMGDGQTAAGLEETRSRFMNRELQVVCMTTAGEMGLNLDAAAHLICLDVLYNEARMRQVYGRIRRASSTHTASVVIRLLARETLEERALELLQQRGALLDYLDSSADYSMAQMTDLMKLLNRRISLLDGVS